MIVCVVGVKIDFDALKAREDINLSLCSLLAERGEWDGRRWMAWRCGGVGNMRSLKRAVLGCLDFKHRHSKATGNNR